MTHVGPSGADDAALLAAAAAGDEQAFAAFYRRHVAAITGFHLRRTGRRELAFDLTAETFAAVVVACWEYDPGRGLTLPR
jgi:DNA-directed RNA polymerase specialized sigma24 family protein